MNVFIKNFLLNWYVFDNVIIYTDSTGTFRLCVTVILYEIFCSPFGWKKNCMVLPPLFLFYISYPI